MQTKRIEPGINFFKECFADNVNGAYEEKSYYVDKSSFIDKAFDDLKKIALFTRPRRFGKSMFLTLLDSFFAPNSQDPNDLSKHEAIFSKLDIYKNSEFCQKYMGKVPVLYITFAGRGSNNSYEDSLKGLARSIKLCASRYTFLKESNALSKDDKELFISLTKLSDLSLSNADLASKVQDSLSDLSNLLSKHFGKNVIILVDEYDVPLDKASNTDYYTQFKLVLANMLEAGFKTNEKLAKGFITGCLRVAKESIFTGWNNFCVVDYDDPAFSSLFGFTDDEIIKMLKNFGFEDKYQTYKDWYDGYHFGNDDIYCPWDVVSYTAALLKNSKSSPKTYWNHTGDNELAVIAFARDPNTYADGFEKLLQEQSIEVPFFDDLNYKMVKGGGNKDTPYLWSVLYMTGYLTADKDQSNLKKKHIRLCIPNKCVKECLKEQIALCFTRENPTYVKSSSQIADCFFNDDPIELQRRLTKAMYAYVSIYDTQKGTDKEALYHAFLNGTLSATLDNQEQDFYASNYELGDGRADIVFLLNGCIKNFVERPGKFNRKLVIIECKVASNHDELEQKANLAITQIKEKYLKGVDGKFSDASVVAMYGIAFYKKECIVKLELQNY